MYLTLKVYISFNLVNHSNFVFILKLHIRMFFFSFLAILYVITDNIHNNTNLNLYIISINTLGIYKITKVSIS